MMTIKRNRAGPNRQIGMKVPPELEKWLARHGQPLASQAKDDLGMFRALCELAETAQGDSLRLSEALVLARKLRGW